LVLRTAAAMSGRNDLFAMSERSAPRVRDVASEQDTESGRTFTQSVDYGPSDGEQENFQSARAVGPTSPAVSRRANVTCYLCEEVGHYQNECPLRNTNGSKVDISPIRPQNLLTTYAHTNSPQKRDPSSVKFASPIVSGKQSPSSWSKFSSPSTPTQSSTNGNKDSGPYTPQGRLSGAFLRQVVAARIAPPVERSTLQSLTCAGSRRSRNRAFRHSLPAYDRKKGEECIEEFRPKESESPTIRRSKTLAVRLRLTTVYVRQEGDIYESISDTVCEPVSDGGVQLPGESAFDSNGKQSDERAPSALHVTDGTVWRTWLAKNRQEPDSDDESDENDMCTALEVLRASCRGAHYASGREIHVAIIDLCRFEAGQKSGVQASFTCHL